MLWLVSLPLLLVYKVIAHCLSHLSEVLGGLFGSCANLQHFFFCMKCLGLLFLISEVPWTFNESISVLSACRNFLSY